MSPVDLSSVNNDQSNRDSNNSALVHLQSQSRPSSAHKRKLDDYAPSVDSEDEDGAGSELVSVRMRKDVAATSNGSSSGEELEQEMLVQEVEAAARKAGSSVTAAASLPSRPGVQFFVRMMSEGKTMVIQANVNDTVKSIHERIQIMTGIPVIEQRLIYRGKQLQWEQTLADCAIQNDAGLQLVGRMRSTEYPQAWQVIDGMVSIICRLCRGEHVQSAARLIKDLIHQFLAMSPKDENNVTGMSGSHFQIFMSSSAPSALVMLYISGKTGTKEIAESSIKHLLKVIRTDSVVSKSLYSHCAPIVLEFCKLLRKCTSHEDNLYTMCRSSLATLLESVAFLPGTKFWDDLERVIMISDILPFVKELGRKLHADLRASTQLAMTAGPLETDVHDFSVFLLPLHKAIAHEVASKHLIPLGKGGYSNFPVMVDEIEYLRTLLFELLAVMEACLDNVQEQLQSSRDSTYTCSAWAQYLIILKELNRMAKLYETGEDYFWRLLRFRRSAVCALIVRYAKRTDDNRWLLERKDVTNFESRRLLALMMFPDVREDYEELHEMLIDRSQLLAESFEYIGRAERESLHTGLFMEFKNEEATGPGVLREWFFLVCQEIFNPQNALFVPCPCDRRRFLPNPGKLYWLLMHSTFQLEL